MYEYKAGRGGLGALGTDPFNWRRRSCSGGDGVSMRAGEVACVPPNATARATSRGCAPTSVGNTRLCVGGGSFYCCPNRTQMRELQQGIVSSGCALPQYGVDGLWGPETARGVQCMIERDGWQEISSRFSVIQGLVPPPVVGETSPTVIGPVTGSTRLTRREPVGNGLGVWGYVGIGGAALVLGFAIAQMLKSDDSKEEWDEYGVSPRPSLAGSY